MSSIKERHGSLVMELVLEANLLYRFLEPHGQRAFLLIWPLFARLDRPTSIGVEPIRFWIYKQLMKQRHGYKYQTIQHNGKKSKRKRNQGDRNLVLIEEKKRILYNGIQHFSQPIWVTQSSLQSSLNIIQKVVYNEADTKNSMCEWSKIRSQIHQAWPHKNWKTK